MPLTIFNGTYAAPSCTNLTQSVSRSGTNSQATTPMVLTTGINYSKVFTGTFAISSANPSTITLAATTPGVSLTRVSNTYTVTSTYNSPLGVPINNWAYFKHLLQNLNIVTDNTVWPNPAFTIAASVSDATTNLTGTISVSAANADAPTAPVASISRSSKLNALITWTASVQNFGPGVVGYYIFRDGGGSPIASVTSGLSYTDTGVGVGSHTYTVQAYDGSSPVVTSAVSNTVTLAAASLTAPVASINRTGKTQQTVTWTAAVSSWNSGVWLNTYDIYKDSSYVTTVTGVLTYVDSSATVNSHTYTVIANDAPTTSVSASSNTVTGAASTLSTPTAVSAVRTVRDSATITWAGSTSNYGTWANTYQVLRDAGVIASGVSALTYTDTTVDPNTSYTYTIQATDSPVTSSVSTGNVLASIGKVYIGQYQSGSTRGFQTSPDSITWTARTLPSPGTTYYHTPVLGHAAMAAISGTTTASYSIDGLTWSAATLSISANQIVSDGSTFVATTGTSGGSNTTSFNYSTDNITWTSGTLPTTGNWYPLYIGSTWVMFDPAQTTIYLTSANGISWTSRSTPASGAFPVAAGGGTYLAYSGSTTDVYTSSDCISWTLRSGVIPGVSQQFQYANSQFVCLPANVGGTGAFSSNGISWTTFTVPTTPGTVIFNQPTFGNGRWISINGSNAAATTLAAYSANPITSAAWTTSTVSSGFYYGDTTAGTQNPYIIYANSLFSAIGFPSGNASRWLMTSPDGITWTNRAMLGAAGNVAKIVYY